MYQMRGKVDVGDQAPGFKAKDVTYHEINEIDYRGRNNLVLFFYRNSRCQTCREELTGLANKFGDIVRMDGDVVAISTDDFETARDMGLDLHLPYHIISDPDGRIIKEYGVYDNDTNTAFPALFLVDKNGVVRYRKIIGGIDDLVSGDEVVERLRGMGTSHGESVISSFRPD